MVGSGHPIALPTGRHPGVRVMIKWAYCPAVRRRRLRRDRLEKVVSKVIATTTARPCLAAIFWTEIELAKLGIKILGAKKPKKKYK
jgi:hypothetical protein